MKRIEYLVQVTRERGAEVVSREWSEELEGFDGMTETIGYYDSQADADAHVLRWRLIYRPESLTVAERAELAEMERSQ